MKMLLYCTKKTPWLYKQTVGNSFTLFLTEKKFDTLKYLNGKVVAECDYEVEEINPSIYEMYDGFIYKNPQEEEKLKGTCLSAEEMYLYLQDKTGYAIHIKSLKIFDEPKELSDYSKRIKNDFQVLGTAPQNMMKCVSLFTTPILDYVLISIQPQWLFKILNGEKTIEVRKKVLKEML